MSFTCVLPSHPAADSATSLSTEDTREDPLPNPFSRVASRATKSMRDSVAMRSPSTSPGGSGAIWRESVIELADGRVLGVAEFGPPDGFPILWFHGTPGARKQVPPAARAHAERKGVRLIGIERPGVGRSTPHHYGRLIDSAADIEQVMDLLGLPRLGLIGLSGGGPYVLAACSALPDRVAAAAVLGGVGPSAGPEKVAGGGAIPWLRRLHPILPRLRDPVATVVSAGVRLAAPVADRVFDIYLNCGPKSDRAFLARPEMREMFIADLVSSGRESLRGVAYDLVLFSRWWGFDIADIRTPVYLWHGDADLVIPLHHGQRLAELIPNSRLSVVAGQGHLSMLDAAEEAIDLILTHAPEAPGRMAPAARAAQSSPDNEPNTAASADIDGTK